MKQVRTHATLCTRGQHNRPICPLHTLRTCAWNAWNRGQVVARCVDSGRCLFLRVLCSGLRCVRWTARSTSRRSPTSADACKPSPPKSTRDLCSIEEGRGMRSRFILKHCFAGRRRLRQQPCLQRHPTGTNSWSGCRPAMIGALAPARPARSPGRRPPWLLRCTRWPGTATARSDYPRGRWPRESAAPRSRASRWAAAQTNDSSNERNNFPRG